MSREYVLYKVRTALGRGAGRPIPEPPPVRIRIPHVNPEERYAGFLRSVEALAGSIYRANSAADACAHVAGLIRNQDAVASNAPFLQECGITQIPGVKTGFTGSELKAACALAAFGITSADYALADTGTLVILASPQEARLISLLPPAHIAVVPKERVLTGLDELMQILPRPAELTSSMVLITGPSRTADIEQILVRGVHGPGEIYVILV